MSYGSVMGYSIGRCRFIRMRAFNHLLDDLHVPVLCSDSLFWPRCLGTARSLGRNTPSNLFETYM